MVVALIGIVHQRSDGDQNKVVGAKVDTSRLALADPMDAHCLLATVRGCEIDVRHLRLELQGHTVVDQPPRQGLNAR